MVIALLIIITLLLSKIAFGFWVTLVVVLGTIASPFVIFFAWVAVSLVAEGHLFSVARQIYEVVLEPLKWLDKRLMENNILNERRGAALLFCWIIYFGIIGTILYEFATALILLPIKLWLLIDAIVEDLSVNYPRIFD